MPKGNQKDYYKILGVSENASQEDIKRAYRRLAHEYHPDKAGGSEEKFKEINEAYQVLSDRQKRAQYDMLRKYGASYGGGEMPFGFGFPEFDFSGAGLGAFEDLLQEFFGGGFRTATKTRSSRISTGITFHGPNGTTLYVEITKPTALTPQERARVEELGRQILDILSGKQK